MAAIVPARTRGRVTFSASNDTDLALHSGKVIWLL